LNGLKYHVQHTHKSSLQSLEASRDSGKPFISPKNFCQKAYKTVNGLRYHLQNHPILNKFITERCIADSEHPNSLIVKPKSCRCVKPGAKFSTEKSSLEKVSREPARCSYFFEPKSLETENESEIELESEMEMDIEMKIEKFTTELENSELLTSEYLEGFSSEEDEEMEPQKNDRQPAESKDQQPKELKKKDEPLNQLDSNLLLHEMFPSGDLTDYHPDHHQMEGEDEDNLVFYGPWLPNENYSVAQNEITNHEEQEYFEEEVLETSHQLQNKNNNNSQSADQQEVKNNRNNINNNHHHCRNNEKDLKKRKMDLFESSKRDLNEISFNNQKGPFILDQEMEHYECKLTPNMNDENETEIENGNGNDEENSTENSTENNQENHHHLLQPLPQPFGNQGIDFNLQFD